MDYFSHESWKKVSNGKIFSSEVPRYFHKYFLVHTKHLVWQNIDTIILIYFSYFVFFQFEVMSKNSVRSTSPHINPPLHEKVSEYLQITVPKSYQTLNFDTENRHMIRHLVYRQNHLLTEDINVVI